LFDSNFSFFNLRVDGLIVFLLRNTPFDKTAVILLVLNRDRHYEWFGRSEVFHREIIHL